MLTQKLLLRQSFMLLNASKVCPDNTIKDWAKAIVYLHIKGWLYVHFKDEAQEVVDVVAGAYRVNGYDPKKKDVFPEKEQGNRLYIPFAASTSKDPLVLRGMLGNLLKDYKKRGHSIRELIFYDWNNENKLKRFKRKPINKVEVKKEKKHGKK